MNIDHLHRQLDDLARKQVRAQRALREAPDTHSRRIIQEEVNTLEKRRLTLERGLDEAYEELDEDAHNRLH